MLGVAHDSVQLWVDCKQVADKNGSFRPPLEVRAPIDATDGAFTVAKKCHKLETVPVRFSFFKMLKNFVCHFIY